MRFSHKADAFKPVTDEIVTDGDKAVTRTMDEVTVGLKTDYRNQVEQSGLGRRLANTWQGRRYPQQRMSMDASAFVWSKAPKLIDAFARGVTIVPINGAKYLAIPTKDAGVSHTSTRNHARLTPALWEAETGVKLHFVKRPGWRNALLMADGRYRRQARKYQSRQSFKPIRGPRLPGDKKAIAIFILVPAVKLRQRLDIEAPANKWAGAVGDLIVKNWN